jgi:NitT/TauT family transport system ATP-binding protein
MNHPALKVSDLYHSFGNKKVLNNINLEIKAGQIVSMVGPSGCGKSTLLRSILGTPLPFRGQIWADDIPVSGPSRNIGIVYQSYGLYDFLTARRNVSFGLKVDQTNIPQRLFRPFWWRKLEKQHFAQAEAMLTKVGLEDAFDSYPSELSGGMKQRVAIAQALILRPSILLMDEPFGALDESTRESLQLMLLHLYQENIEAKKAGKRPPHTILIVTHELNEALYVSDRVVGLSQYHIDGKNGSTIVYDQPTPVFRPEDPKDFSRFQREKEDIRKVVFSPEYNQDHSRFITAWTDSTVECLPGDPNLSRERI